jgi:tripartite-type tricarboxylate transporter receptor subunit TctC
MGENMLKRLMVARTVLACAAGIALMASAQAQYPDRPITMLVPFAAGGSSDIIARLVSEEMGQVLGQRIIIENIAGAGGATGFTRLANAAPDGYTIAIGNAGTSAATYATSKDLKFTPDSFAPVGMVAKTLPVIAIKNGFPAQNLKEFLDYAKANPGKVTLGHAGIGSSNYLICKLFLQASQAKIELIGYRGAGPALNDAMGGHIDGVCDSATSIASPINAGQVRGLIVSAQHRPEILPNVPTVIEAGLPAFLQEGWNMLFLPKGAPAPVVEALNAAIRKALVSEKLKKRFAELGTSTPSGDELIPAKNAAFVEAEVKKYKDLLAE